MTITIRDAVAAVTYDSASGLFTRAKSSGRKRAGSVAGYVKADGYRLIWVKSRWVYAHRLAWLLVWGEWPEHEIDHINGDRDDNRIANLRHCTRSQNMANIRHGGGWHWHKRNKKWQALIRVNRRRLYLGLFATEDEAKAAYEQAVAAHHGEFSPASPTQEAMEL